MTTVATLLARKQKLLELLHEQPGPAELAEIDRQLVEINQALDLIESTGAPTSPERPIVQPVHG
ncbi:MAG TPA: hypothetical protein VKY22_16495 [Bradyrhizobium sp.]|nr:hypothetical protein [Bradyrhizobium sp.]